MATSCVIAKRSTYVQVAQTCNRPVSMCEDMYLAHKAFLSTITQDNADLMWQYFSSFAAVTIAPPPNNDGGGTPVNAAMAGGGRGRGGGRVRGTGRTPNHAATPTEHAAAAGRHASKRTPRRLDMHVRSPALPLDSVDPIGPG